MANEISIICKATVSKSGTTITNATSTKTLDMTGDNMFHAIINFSGTTRERLDTQFTDIDTTANYNVLVRNRHATEVITLYSTDATDYPITTVPGGSLSLFCVVGGKAVWGAFTATADAEFAVWEA